MRGRPKPLLVLVLAALAVVAAACASDASGGGEGDIETLSLAVTDLQGLEELQREFGAFVEELEAATGYQIEFFPVNDRVAAAAALQADRVDLVFTGPAEYVVMVERTDARPVIAIRRPGYRSCIYTHTSTGISDVSELTGKKIGMSDVGSTSGHLGPSQILVDAGLDPLNDLEVLTIGDAVHEAIKRGDVDAVGIGCHDYAEYMESDDEADYPLLAEGDPLPADVVIAHPDLPDEVVETFRNAFRERWDALLDAILVGEDNQKYRDAELLDAPTDSDYDSVRAMYRAIGVDDFSEFVGD